MQTGKNRENNKKTRSMSAKNIHPEIIAQGAEAVLTKKGSILIKDRIKKRYRIPQIDNALRKKRTKLEQRIMRSARRAGVATPQIFDTEKDNVIEMQFIKGKVLRKFSILPDIILEKIGKNIAKLHQHNIIHGDLTTSNMILKNQKNAPNHFSHNHPDDIPKSSGIDKKAEISKPEVYFIDFGLSFISAKPEDKAVDLQLLKQALNSTHKNAETAWNKVLKVYSNNYNKSAGVLQRLSALEKRGRYKRGKH